MAVPEVLVAVIVAFACAVTLLVPVAVPDAVVAVMELLASFMTKLPLTPCAFM